MKGGASRESRLTIRPNADRAVIAAVGSLLAGVCAYFGATSGTFWAVFFALVALLLYLPGVTIDRRSGIVTKRGRLGLTRIRRPLGEFNRVVLTRVEGKRVSYEVRLCGDGEPFEVVRDDTNYFSARDHAERIARFLGVAIHDSAAGETVARRGPEPVTGPEPMPARQTPTDETDLLAIRHEMPENWELVLIAVSGMPVLGVIFVPNMLGRAIMAVLGALSTVVFLRMVLHGVLIDRRRYTAKQWRLLVRFGRECSLSGYQVVSIKPLVTQSVGETSSSRFLVCLDGDTEPLHLNTFAEHAKAQELARRVAEFLAFEVRDLTQHA